MKIGTLVQLLDSEGNPWEGIIGTVIAFRKGKADVHWHCGAENLPGALYQWGWLKVLSI